MITEYEINAAIDRLKNRISSRIDRHGTLPHHSRHESVAICDEEMTEIKMAVHQKSQDQDLADEYLDLACAAIWAFLSVDKYQGTK